MNGYSKNDQSTHQTSHISKGKLLELTPVPSVSDFGDASMIIENENMNVW